MIDRNEKTPSLEEMTNAAIERLNKNKNGFFLMVEGSQIDWAGHDNDIVGAMSEMEDFEKAFKAAIEFAKKDKKYVSCCNGRSRYWWLIFRCQWRV